VSRIQDGKRVRLRVSGRTKSEIKGRLKVLHEEIDQGVKPSASYTMADALTDWLEHGLDGRSPKTVSTYREVTAPLLPLIGAIHCATSRPPTSGPRSLGSARNVPAAP
jgi:hypothetical protein